MDQNNLNVKKPRGRPSKFVTEEERIAAKKAYRAAYYKNYYQQHKEQICQREREKYAELKAR